MLPDLPHLALAGFQATALLAAAPLVSGFARVMRAKMHNRQGPGLLQDYRDIVKLMQRQEVWPPDSGWVFKAMPMLVMAVLLVIATGTPIFTLAPPIHVMGDLVLSIYLYALARFFLSLSGIDSGSSFAGIGASRELTVGVLVEPTMLLSLFVAALLAGSTDEGAIATAIANGHMQSAGAAVLAGLAFAFGVYVELGKLPYDMAEAEQELQEGPLTEYSGPSLALLKWALALKQTLVVGWFVGLFLPFGASADLSIDGVFNGALAFALKALVIFAIVGVLSNAVARVRFRFTPRHSWAGVGVASLAFVFYLVGV
ncbi:hydrogenase-4 component C [Rhodoblastus acidophilus]|uniref:respiratory chain complex I subunit 1 family protein n=1 Tax=Rhodoblastus acidophilus TaxID=1074 RepID=UPI0022254EA0|nr:NADH-quinone oxidoreductase subunit H [Rhodoblastus acidophilus]MCW2285411.1 hydrogenase-4 component C [Rhodoblastus acidophilus]MCW2334340.1 hydrogenase-4 component C [Rhodoblastus acidophilus]